MCALCHIQSKRRDVVRKHIKMVHFKVRNHHCTLCDAAFATKQVQLRHEKKCKIKTIEMTAKTGD